LARASEVASFSDGCIAGSDWRALLDRADIGAVVIATPQDSQVEIARAAINAGIHVLVEKPAARHADELLGLPELAAKHNVRVRVGFNLRYHRAFQQARRLVDSGILGPLLFLRARYGHGGRLGLASEWRAQPQRSGGGELIDQGVHLIDLARWFLGEFVEVNGFAHTYFWDMPVDDNGFMLLKTNTKQAAFLHVSCTEWKNTFSWELYGRDGKLQVDWAAAMASNDCRGTRICPTWDHLKPRSGNTRWRTIRGNPKCSSSWRTSVAGASPPPGCTMRLPRLPW
jgi:predicted dehydrogenase